MVLLSPPYRATRNQKFLPFRTGRESPVRNLLLPDATRGMGPWNPTACPELVEGSRKGRETGTRLPTALVGCCSSIALRQIWNGNRLGPYFPARGRNLYQIGDSPDVPINRAPRIKLRTFLRVDHGRTVAAKRQIPISYFLGLLAAKAMRFDPNNDGRVPYWDRANIPDSEVDGMKIIRFGGHNNLDIKQNFKPFCKGSAMKESDVGEPRSQDQYGRTDDAGHRSDSILVALERARVNNQ